MLQKDADTNAKKAPIVFRCGECIHFERISKFDTVCVKLGVTKHAKAPSCFSPNVFSLQKVSPDILSQIGLLLKDFTPAQSRVLLALIAARSAYSRYGLSFGQPVYFHIGGDFLGNYFRGFVAGVSGSHDPVVYVTSDMNRRQMGKPALMMLLPDSVFTVSAFKKKKKELVSRSKLNDPKAGQLFKRPKPKTVDETYQPPTMESVPDHWFDAYRAPTPKLFGSQVKKTKTGSEFKVKDLAKTKT